MNCADLTTATVNGTKLDRYMFWYCTGLTTLIAPNVTEIDECAELCDARYLALKNCSDLKLCFLHTL